METICFEEIFVSLGTRLIDWFNVDFNERNIEYSR